MRYPIRSASLVLIAVTSVGAAAQAKLECADSATSMKNVSTNAAGTVLATSNYTCSFNRSAVTVTCQVSSDLPGGSKIQQATTTTYASIDDYISQFAVVPPVSRLQRLQTDGGLEITYTYDAQKRLVREVTATPSARMTLTWSEWDRAGRPTKGTWTSPGPVPAQGQVETVTYDEVAKTSKRVTSAGPYAGTLEIEFDKAGNQSRQKVVNPVGTTIAVMAVLKTEQVCR